LDTIQRWVLNKRVHGYENGSCIILEEAHCGGSKRSVHGYENGNQIVAAKTTNIFLGYR
jgi:hypothetical protein